jgi:hypothetical protein
VSFLGIIGWLHLAIAAITFPAFDLRLGVLAAVYGKGSANVILGLGELAALPAHVAFVALMRLDQCSRHICFLIFLEPSAAHAVPAFRPNKRGPPSENGGPFLLSRLRSERKESIAVKLKT